MESIKELIDKLNNIYNLDLKYKKEYLMAFTHSSYINEKKNLEKHEHYERLEFLGDAALEIAVSKFLYDLYPVMPEGQLTKTRASLVCEPTLVKYALILNFDKYIYLGKGEEKIGGRIRPALLADIYESFIGALFIDKGLDGVYKFLYATLFQEIANKVENSFVDYKTILQEYISKEKLGDISYNLLSAEGPSHDKIFESAVVINGKVLGKGTAKTKKESEQLSAKEALTILNYF